MGKKEDRFLPPLRNPADGSVHRAGKPYRDHSDEIDETYRSIERVLRGFGETLRAKEALEGMEADKPDTYGCDRYFLLGFMNEGMEDDFPLIAQDFLLREGGNLSSHEDVQYVDFDAGDECPDEAFNLFVLNLMMNAFRSGSEYAGALFKYLHKTYYKKEYKALKRFGSLSVGELLALAKPDGEYPVFSDNLARILFIAEAYGIRIEPDCRAIYSFLNDCVSRESVPDRFSFPEKFGEIFQDCLREIEEDGSLDGYFALDEKASKFLGSVFRWLGYGPDYADQCDENDRGLARQLATALAILKKTFPKETFTPWEITLFGTIVHVASALTCNEDWLVCQMKTLAYGKDGTDFYDEFPERFRPDEVMGTAPARQAPARDKGAVGTKPAGTGEERISDMAAEGDGKEAELSEALRRIRQLEHENADLRASLSGRHALERENRALNEQADAMNRELSALRSHVYRLTEEDEPVSEAGREVMIRELSKLRIIIVGGHVNWVSKLRKVFPDWTYVNPEASGTLDASVVEGADHLYFFSDTLSHSTYYRYLNAVREKKVGFGYVHGVNLDRNLSQMYRELCGK